MIVPLNVAAPAETLPDLPLITELQQQIISGLDASTNTKENCLAIPRKVRPRKTKKRDGKKLSMLDPEEIPASGPCPGGTYYYLDNRDNLIKLLQNWTSRKAWVAIDLETGIAWREKLDPEDGEMIRYYDEIIDPYTCPIYLVSMSVEPGVAVVFDMRPLKEDEVFLAVWREFLTTCKFVAHNSMFEQCFLTVHFGVMCNIVYDTMLVHQLMTAGLDISSSLGEMLQRYCGLTLDKQWQKFFLSIDHRSPLPAECIAYSAGDVCQLLALAQKLEVELKEKGLHHIWSQYEQPFMRWMALAKVEGIAVNTEFFEKMNTELAEELQHVHSKFCALCPNVLISSPAQLKTWFSDQGLKLRSTNIAALGKLTDLPAIGEVAQTILTYRKLAKMKSTYIEPMIRTYPSPITHKIHPNWGQLFTSTGRMNCNEPNFQNMPAREERWVKIRNGFIAKPGHKLAYCDYSQFEVRAMADMANEQNMIDVFLEAETLTEELKAYCKEHDLPSNLAEKAAKNEAAAALLAQHPQVVEFEKRLANLDFHKRTASLLFGVPVEEVTKDQRTKAKTITFAKPYGAGPKKIAQAAGIDVDEATRLFKDYDVKFPKLAAFLEQCREKAKQGFTESPTGRRRFYQQPNYTGILLKVTAIEKASRKQSPDDTKVTEWDEMVETWGTTDPHELADKIFRMKIGAIEREGMNHPIQACNADATKLATVLAAPRLQKLDKECTIIAWVHDEIILTAPDALVEQAANILRDSMIEAAQRLLVRTPVDVSITIGSNWGK